jgi:hypothetical protein
MHHQLTLPAVALKSTTIIIIAIIIHLLLSLFVIQYDIALLIAIAFFLWIIIILWLPTPAYRLFLRPTHPTAAIFVFTQNTKAMKTIPPHSFCFFVGPTSSLKNVDDVVSEVRRIGFFYDVVVGEIDYFYRLVELLQPRELHLYPGNYTPDVNMYTATPYGYVCSSCNYLTK